MAYLTQEQLSMMGFKSLGVNVKVSDKASIYNAEQIEIGDNSRIDDFCVVSRKYKKEYRKAVFLGKHVIIGAGSIIFPGVHIAEGCSVGAMTLVNKSTDPWGIYIGNPAKRIRERKKDLLNLEDKFLEEIINDSI